MFILYREDHRTCLEHCLLEPHSSQQVRGQPIPFECQQHTPRSQCQRRL
jgi:hypothetical protein